MYQTHGGMESWHMACPFVGTGVVVITQPCKRSTHMEEQEYNSCGLS